MSQPTPPIKPIYDCLILSGGGAKGSYGAGVAKALMAYRAKKSIANPLCYIGTSAGALNAYMLAAKNENALIEFWLKITNQVLGVRIINQKYRAFHQYVWRNPHSKHPFSLYPSTALEKLIRETVRFEDVADKPLIITATDYTRGRLRAFYTSDLIDKMVKQDATQEEKRQRFQHLRRIKTTEELVKALLASAAIPIYFPPVQIATEHRGRKEIGWYVDGGVGNHTPTREGAYFFRYLEEMNLGLKGVAYCVKQDPPRVLLEGRLQLGFFDILKRTLDVYHHVYMGPIIRAWTRINSEVKEQEARVERMKKWLPSRKLSEETVHAIIEELTREFINLGGDAAPRLDARLIEIEPIIGLGDSLDFVKKKTVENIRYGHDDALRVIQLSSQNFPESQRLDQAELDNMLNEPIFPADISAGTTAPLAN